MSWISGLFSRSSHKLHLILILIFGIALCLPSLPLATYVSEGILQTFYLPFATIKNSIEELRQVHVENTRLRESLVDANVKLSMLEEAGRENIRLRSVLGFEPPTGSLSTTAALALSVFVAVALFGIEKKGVGDYLKSYVKPTFIMLPFNLISELSRTLALAVRLFGNMMSGAMIIGILLTITPFIFPIVMTLLGLLTGMVQAYIFTILAAVYIAAAMRVRKPEPEPRSEP
mgnify:CR=1 FL=1